MEVLEFFPVRTGVLTCEDWQRSTPNREESHILFLNKSHRNPFVPVKTASMMLCLQALSHKQAYRQEVFIHIIFPFKGCNQNKGKNSLRRKSRVSKSVFLVFTGCAAKPKAVCGVRQRRVESAQIRLRPRFFPSVSTFGQAAKPESSKYSLAGLIHTTTLLLKREGSRQATLSLQS